MLRTITALEIENLIYQAKSHPRKRLILRLHEHEDLVQRMVNALIPGTYITPHKHENPDKVELFSILYGHVAVLEFNDLGDVISVVRLQPHGVNRVVEITPRSYHTIIAIEPSAVVEIIQGPYIETTHKQFATWCPDEDNPKARDYLMYLQSIIENWR
jgi:cupin fold WbuC family metalloprotein